MPILLKRSFYWVQLPLLAFGLVLLSIAFFAVPLGFDIKEDFLLYHLVGLSRGNCAILGALVVALALLPTALPLIRPLLPTPREGLLMVASIAVALLLLEAGLRLANGLPVVPDRNLLFERALVTNRWPINEYHPLVGWVHKANQSFNKDSIEHSMTTGEFGVRMNQAEIRPVPKGGILAVGASFTEGAEVGDSGTWPAALERTLGEPVVNAGIGGWSADQTILRAEELLPVLLPKTIVIALLDDNILWTQYRVYGGGPKPYFLIRNGALVHMNNPVPRAIEGPPTDFGLIAGVLGYSYLMDRVMSQLGVNRWFEIGNYAKIDTDPVLVTCLLLERLQRAAETQGSRVVLMMQWLGNYFPRWRAKRSDHAVAVLNCASAAGIATFDAWEALKAVAAQGEDKLKALYNMHQGGNTYGHMSPAGNQFIAELLARTLRAEPTGTAAVGR